ncbi:MAG: DUF305 domain-containing protein [Pseudomonadota bacterium]|nr:DUF305 domain-containing protein [Pseudomonadota bacterium]
MRNLRICPQVTSKVAAYVATFAFIFIAAANVQANDVPILQPGLPGEGARLLTAEEAVKITDTSYSPDDVAFMQGMIPHHKQALEMAVLVAQRTNRPELGDIAGRIKASQSDEIEFMQSWLTDRGEAAGSMAMSTQHSSHGTDGTMHSTTMKGMASPEQMAQLAASESTAFDRLFLQLMIAHHEGAVEMVEHLLDQPGSAYDPVLYEFVGDVKNDQLVEIERMHALLVTLSDDPRANLTAGLYDAGIAIKNLRLISTQTKPPGFVDPNNPGEVPKAKPPEDSAEQASAQIADGSESTNAEPAEKAKPTEGRGGRYPMLSFSNTDMAFSKNTLVAGNYHGFNIYDISSQGTPELMSSVVCPGGQGDVSVVGDLLIMSVQETRSRLDCGLQGVAEDVSDERFRGIRIFDISDLRSPKQVGAVQTCRGSHTHSVVSGPGDDGKIIVYNSGTSSIREREEMDSCFDESPGDPRTALFRIDVIEIPVANPALSRIVSSPAVFADDDTGALAGLWRGGDHGDETQDTRPTDECHDITVFPAANIAAGACSGNGILFDISDPLNPTRIDVVSDSGFAYWHSATFNNDGTKVLFTDEWGGGTRARCRAYDPLDWGADAIYDIVDGKLIFKSYFKIPAPQLEQENCVAHNGAIVPVPGRDLFVQAWYQGGISIIDFTDSSNPVEIAYFDRGPIDAKELVTGGYWSTYWYNGLIYGTEIIRGLDVFELLPSEYLSENEIAASNLADQGAVFNPQQQFPVSWPSHPQIALAYMDQMKRAGQVVVGDAELRQALKDAQSQMSSGANNPQLGQQILALANAIDTGGKQTLPLKETLAGIATALN